MLNNQTIEKVPAPGKERSEKEKQTVEEAKRDLDEPYLFSTLVSHCS
jgi:hypothetical protein